MSAPPLLVGAALAFWGWQSNHLAAGVLLGLGLEALRLSRLRLELGTAEHSRISDLSTVGFVLLAILLGANLGVSRGILEAFIWAPVALAPILVAQLLAEGRRLPLSALFRYMRRLRRENPEIRDPMVDVSAVYVALVVISAGVANARGQGYFIGVVVAAAWALAWRRPRHSPLAAWVLMLGLAVGLGYAAQVGLASLQARIESWVVDLNFRGLDADPYRTVTAIGSIGRLKQNDEIVLRVYAGEGDSARVRLLHRASYNTYAGGSWLAREAPMQPLESAADNTTWPLGGAGEPAWRVGIATQLQRGKALLALPAGTLQIAELTAVTLRRNALGAVHADIGAEWARYEPQGVDRVALYASPSAADTQVPVTERAVFERVAAELELGEVAPAEALRRIQRHLAGFSYSLYRERTAPYGETALGDFMTRTRAGHCEYFAAAATLLLRAAGIPARYATGYAVNEYSRLEQAWLVRARHAHAWTRAWVGGEWVDLDTTPPDWFGIEEAEAPLWQGLADLLRWAGFRWTMREEIKAGEAWYGVLAILALVLAWRLFRGKRLRRDGADGAAAARTPWPGEDSEFYALERALSLREPHETHAAWLARVAGELPEPKRSQLREALRLHQRYRFDPVGIAPDDRAALRTLCRSLMPLPKDTR